MREENFWNENVRDDYGVLFMSISKLLEAHAIASVKDEAIRFPEVRYLGYMQNQDRPVTLKEVETALGLASPTVAGAVKSLERRGLVAMTTDTQDRRVKLVTLTDSARELMQRQEDYRKGMERELISSLTDDEGEYLKDILRKVLARLESLPLEESRTRTPAGAVNED